MKRTSVPTSSIAIPRGRGPRWTNAEGGPATSPDPTIAQLEWTARLLRLLGDPTRLRLLYLLRRAGGGLPVYELARLAEVEPSTVSHALRLLRAHDIVRSRREGKMVAYFLDSSDVAAMLDRFVV